MGLWLVSGAESANCIQTHSKSKCENPPEMKCGSFPLKNNLYELNAIVDFKTILWVINYAIDLIVASKKVHTSVWKKEVINSL